MPEPNLHDELAHLLAALLAARGEQDEYLSIQEAADLVKVNHKTMRAKIDAGELPVAAFGSALRVRRSDIDALFSSRARIDIEKAQEPIERRLGRREQAEREFDARLRAIKPARRAA
jgi:excisionase family DNA binding protein